MKKIILILLLLAMPAAAQRKYVVPADGALLEASLDTAIAQVGTIELTGKNDGPVAKYLASVGLPEGYPYCAAGQYYCFAAAADALELRRNLIPIRRTAVANAIYNDAQNRGKTAAYIPARHDLIVWRRRNSFSGHIERIVRLGSGGWVTTVAFNTGGQSDRDGEGVFLRKRNIFHPLGRMQIRGLIGFIPK
jgi:hypothetical protein